MYPEVRIWCSAPTKIVEENTLLISVRAPIGALNFSNTKSCIGRGLAGLTPTEEFDLKYIYYCLKGKHAELNAKGTGSTFKAISKNALGETLVRKIDKKKQLEIVEILDKTYGVICNRKQELEQLDLLIKARFVEMFGDLMINTKGWELHNFDELTIFITDGEHNTPRRTNKGIYLLSARNILNHEIQLDDVDFIDEEEYERIAKRVVPQTGDVLISCSGSVGRCCSVPDGLKFQMVRSAAILRFKDNIRPKFAEYMITSDYVQRQIDASKTASSQANLFQGKIAKLKGFAPPVELQIEFEEFVQQVDKSKVAVQKALDETKLLFDSLMQKYFG